MSRIDRSDPAHLLSLARKGDTQAMGGLFDLYRQYLKLLAHMEISDRLQAKIDPSDIVQETFLEAHRDFAKFRGTTERELMAWLRQILAGNLADRGGARVAVTAGARTQVVWRFGGGSYQAASDPRLLIGLGSAERIEALEVRWPSGRVDRHAGLPADAGYLIREGETTPRPLPGFESVGSPAR